MPVSLVASPQGPIVTNEITRPFDVRVWIGYRGLAFHIAKANEKRGGGSSGLVTQIIGDDQRAHPREDFAEEGAQGAQLRGPYLLTTDFIAAARPARDLHQPKLRHTGAAAPGAVALPAFAPDSTQVIDTDRWRGHGRLWLVEDHTESGQP